MPAPQCGMLLGLHDRGPGMLGHTEACGHVIHLSCVSAAILPWMQVSSLCSSRFTSFLAGDDLSNASLAMLSMGFTGVMLSNTDTSHGATSCPLTPLLCDELRGSEVTKMQKHMRGWLHEQVVHWEPRRMVVVADHMCKKFPKNAVCPCQL